MMPFIKLVKIKEQDKIKLASYGLELIEITGYLQGAS